MKNKKYYIKKNLISFIIGLIIFGGVGVYAAVTFPSNEVTYDNTDSGLSSTNVKGAIDELYNTCTALSPGEQIIEDNNLEKDPYECRYFFTGANPNNYVTFNGETVGWRIISVGCDGTIKIMKDASIGNISWDTSNSNNWAHPASLNTYLNGTYLNSLSSEAKSQIVASDFSIGAVTYNNNDLEGQINDENSTTWNGKIALPTVSEYLRTNSNSKCKTFLSNYVNFATCANTTWMFYSSNYWFTLSSSSGYSDEVFNVSNGGRMSVTSKDNTYTSVRPTLYLSSDVTLSGSGTQSDPYVVN